MVARDLGPAGNDLVRKAFPGYHAWAVVAGAEGGDSRLLPYDEAMARLWGDDPAGAGR